MTDSEVFIALCSNDKLVQSDAIVYLEGDALNRTDKVLELYKNGWAKKIVFSGGIYNETYGSLPYKFISPELIKHVDEESIIVEDQSQHTRQQAENVIQLCKNNNWNSIILVGSHYHQYRAFLTFLKVLIEESLHQTLKIINAPADQLDWFKPHGYGGNRYELMYKEFEKIQAYSINGHVASYKEAIDYLKWKETSQ
jgi:uncharacterized SAM-binding protein YcdF (DUF218 family)